MKAHSARAWKKFPLALAALAIVAGFSTVRAQAPAAAREPAQDQRYAVEYYYKVSWGHADEWLRLFKKNHVPVLKALQAQGRIVEIEMEKPRYHMPEEARWDFRVTITWKNFAASQDPGTEQALVRKLFPDQDTFQKEEQRRFEILIAHWDLPIVEQTLEP
jgi:hypothetical protein